MTLPKGRAHKLSPKFIGPFKIIKDFGNNSFKIDLPSDLKRRGVHPVFHSSLLRLHIPNDDRLFPSREPIQFPSFADDNNPKESRAIEWPVERIQSHSGRKRNALFQVKWKAGDTTWLPYDQVEHLEPLKAYFEALGIDSIDRLPDNVLPPSTDDPQVLLAGIRPSTMQLFGPTKMPSSISDTSTVSSELPPSVRQHIDNSMETLRDRLDLGGYPPRLSRATMRFHRRNGSFSFNDPVNYNHLVFPFREVALILDFTHSVRHENHGPNIHMPERYLTFMRLYNVHAREHFRLPQPPSFEPPQPQKRTIDRFNEVALSHLEQAHCVRPIRYLDDDIYNFSSDHRGMPKFMGNHNKNTNRRRGGRKNRRNGPNQDRKPEAAETTTITLGWESPSMPDLIPIETNGQGSQDKVVQADTTQVEQAERTEEQVSETNKCVTIADEVDDGV